MSIFNSKLKYKTNNYVHFWVKELEVWVIPNSRSTKFSSLHQKNFLKIFIFYFWGWESCSGSFLCFAGLPPAVLLLYWARLPPAVLGLSVLSKGVETSPTGIQFSSACVQIMPRLLGACLRQTELFWMSYGKQTW